MKRRLGRVLLGGAAASLTLQLVVPIPSAYAISQCQSNKVNNQAGRATNQYGGTQPNYFEGVMADISDVTGYAICTNPPDQGYAFSTSWVMWFSSNNAWAQVGYFYWPSSYGSCLKYWAQSKTPSGTPSNYWLGGCAPENGEARTFEAASHIDPADSRYHIYLWENSSLVHETLFDPFNTASPYQLAIDAETWYPQSNIAGTNSNRQNYTSAQVQLYDDSFYPVYGNAYLPVFSTLARYDVNRVDAGHSQTWTG